MYCTFVDWLKATQAFMLMAVLVYIFIFIAAFFAVFKEKSIKIVGGLLIAPCEYKHICFIRWGLKSVLKVLSPRS